MADIEFAGVDLVAFAVPCSQLPAAIGKVGASIGDRSAVLVASKGGYDHHPVWYLNLKADPEVELQVKDDVFKARAHDAQGDERERLWDMMVGEWPPYAEYQTRTDRQIPVVILERA